MVAPVMAGLLDPDVLARVAAERLAGDGGDPRERGRASWHPAAGRGPGGNRAVREGASGHRSRDVGSRLARRTRRGRAADLSGRQGEACPAGPARCSAGDGRARYRSRRDHRGPQPRSASRHLHAATLHNPLGITMPESRRIEIAALLVRHDIVAIEDMVYAFLHDSPPAPIAVHAPNHSIVVDSLSKRVAPGLTLGFLASPPGPLAEAVSFALQSGGWRPQTYGLLAAGRIMTEGLVEPLVLKRRRDAAARQALVRDRLAGFSLRGDRAPIICGWNCRRDGAPRHSWRRPGVAGWPSCRRRRLRLAPATHRTRCGWRWPRRIERLGKAAEILASLARSNPDESVVE